MNISTGIDNSDLLPELLPDDRVTLDENGTPDWAAELILAQIRVVTATKEGTLEAAKRVVDHYAAMGVNGLWVSPIYEPGNGGNGYTNLGPHTVDPRITGTMDYAEGLERVADFVRYAHSKKVRVLLDIISWGTLKGSPMHEEHPDWYTGKDEWGGDAFDWQNGEFREWYIRTAVNIVMVTGCDGFRYDVEPHYAGYDVGREIRSRLQAAGRKPFMMAEACNERMGAYDCEQTGITKCIPGYFEEKPVWYFLNEYNLVDSIKNGYNIGIKKWETADVGCMYRFYVNTLTCHDHRFPVVCGNRLAIGYQAIFSPFIPQWYIGEEWNNPLHIIPGDGGRVLYFNVIDWEALDQPENRAFFEDVKAMIRVRRQHPDVFAYYPPHFRDSNICKVDSSGNLQAYARYSAEKALLIIPNNSDEERTVVAQIPFARMGMDAAGEYGLTDAYTGEALSADHGRLTVTVAPNDQRVIQLVVLPSGLQ